MQLSPTLQQHLTCMHISPEKVSIGILRRNYQPKTLRVAIDLKPSQISASVLSEFLGEHIKEYSEWLKNEMVELKKFHDEIHSVES
jgi:hypothetical protein